MAIYNNKNFVRFASYFLIFLSFVLPVSAMATVSVGTHDWLDLTKHPIGFFSLILTIGVGLSGLAIKSTLLS